MKQAILDNLRKEYPVGARVELVQMDDAQAPAVGTQGTVIGVDDIGSIMVKWDNGSSLNVVYGEDKCKVIETVTTICYGKKRIWSNRAEAIVFFYGCALSSDGAEKERYLQILQGLQEGKAICSD